MQVIEVSPGIIVREDGKYIGLWCEGCNCAHAYLPLNINGRANAWAWDEKTLTLSPSVRHFDKRPAGEVTVCHYNIEQGRVLFHDDCLNHSLRGWRDMLPFPEDYVLGYNLVRRKP